MNSVEHKPFVVLISAGTEWRAVLDLLQPDLIHSTPLGDLFECQLSGHPLLFFHSGWGKTHSAASSQYVIDHWAPKLVINLGTCGGLEDLAQVGEVFLVTKTIMYDVIERMGDPDQAIEFYSTSLDTSWIEEELPVETRRSTLASADQDIAHNNHGFLANIVKVPAADWELASIAWVLDKNETKGLILRGVSDIVSQTRSETDANKALWQSRVKKIMQKLLHDLPFYLDQFK
ncbi:MAG TPA: 5'-methylthioadenosine/S-adenosylhomocysteine nucleosidase [Chloroflexi bacterium]|nr:hypothetical protein [Anaerolineaceae bacterium]HHX08734.1 5'-methylthioadenosine/S-adenosylhomocysteine nucleosidase [Chloroflexota bacterium]